MNFETLQNTFEILKIAITTFHIKFYNLVIKYMLGLELDLTL